MTTSEQVVKCAGCGRTLPNDAIGRLCFKCIRKSGAGVRNERPFINPTEEARQIVCDLAYMLPDTEAVRKQVRDYVEDRFRVAVERLEAERQSDTARLLNVARGCHDYGGGYRGGDDVSEMKANAFHHGIQTVINALEAAAKNDPNDGQINVLERVGRDAIKSTKENANG